MNIVKELLFNPSSRYYGKILLSITQWWRNSRTRYNGNPCVCKSKCHPIDTIPKGTQFIGGSLNLDGKVIQNKLFKSN